MDISTTLAAQLKSKPLRLRGLKCLYQISLLRMDGSKPLRLRGLKSKSIKVVGISRMSKPLRLRGLKLFRSWCACVRMEVEAFAASWIEIDVEQFILDSLESKPLRLRGLKSAGIYFIDTFLRRSLCGFVD